jgi:NADPH:quinone reductase-like Zn-dependent oxidoreductase
MSTMMAVRIHEFGGPEVLRREPVDRPEPSADEVLIEVHATSVNPIDYKIRAGAFPALRAQLPKILGRDVSGMVVKCGEAVSDFRPGDPVFALLDRDHGSYAEYVSVASSLCVPKPQTIDHSTAAAVPLAALTAWQGLFDHAELRDGQSVLIHGGAGGVGHFALQLARARGATVFTTVSGSELEFARRAGAELAIDYKTQRFEDIVPRVDVVFDLVGGETQERSWPVLRGGGVLVSTLGAPPETLARQHHVRAVGYQTEPNVTQLAEIAALIDRNLVKPVVQARFTLLQVADAHHRVESEHTFGKVVIDVIEPAGE